MKSLSKVICTRNIWLSWLFVFLSLFPAFSQVKKYWPKRRFPHLVVKDKLWIGTPRGLYQYHAEDDTWTIYGKHNGLPSNRIQLIQYDGEYLWVVTPEGTAFGDIRLNKWLVYNQENGLPSNKVNSIAFQEDYVWVATDRGAARFDKLIQEWEHFTLEDGLPDSVVTDVIVEEDLVYLSTYKGLVEYDINFEKWRVYPILHDSISSVIKFIYPTTDYLWLFTDQGPLRFNKQLHSILSFPENDQLKFSNIQDLVVDNEKFWSATTAGVFIYDPANILWRPFQEQIHLPDSSVKAMAFSQGKRWFVTETGIAVFDEQIKSWDYYGKAHGLSSQQYDAIATFRSQVFLINNSTIDYYIPQENRWRVYPLKDVSILSQRKTPYVSLDQEKGSFVQITPKAQLGISGSRWNSRFNFSHSFDLETDQSQSENDIAHRRDVKSQLTLPKGQTINGFYDDTDFNQTMYGIRYKGLKKDLVQEVNWGDIRYEQGKTHLIPSIGIFGVSGRLETGSKTEQYGRSLVSAKVWSGEKTTGQDTEFFTGNMHEARISLRDVDYIPYTYFCWDTTDTGIDLDKNSEQIFVDDGNEQTNTRNTLIDFTIGGIKGDFDKLLPFEDYVVDHDKGILMLTRPLSPSAVMILKAKSAGLPWERVLKTTEKSSYTMLNRYFVDGMKIIPSSFSLQITDSTGKDLPIFQFGLDGNRDGRVDPEWIDTREGILSFPSPQPFPQAVYQIENPLSSFLMHIQFETEISIFMLKHNRLIRGTETVTVDGDILTAGQDYIIDYTSGSLLILKEGIVAEDSEIKVKYEFYQNSSEKFHLGGIGFGPSDNILMEVNGFAYDEENSGSDSGSMQGINFFGEFKGKIKGLDFKLTPELAQSLGRESKGSSFHIRTDISSQRIRLYSEYEKYDSEFKNLFPRKFQLGEMEKRLAAGVTVLPLDFLDITGQWSQQQTPKTISGKHNKEENLSGKLLLNKKQLPALSLSLRHRTLKTEEYQSSKQTVKGEVEYKIPASILDMLSLKSIRIYGVWRKSWESRDSTNTHADHSPNRLYDNRYFRIDCSPVNLIQINAYYRGESVTMQNLDNRGKRPLTRQQKWFLDATVDRIQGINLNVRYQSEIAQRFDLSPSGISSITLQRLLQSNIRFFPGQWVRFLSPFTFEINLNPGWKGTLEDNTRKLKWKEKLWQLTESKALNVGEDNMLYQLRGEWRPTASLFLYTGLEFFRFDSKHLDSRSQTRGKRFHNKVEYQPSPQSLITLQYFYTEDNIDLYKHTIRYNPMLWVEHRWNDKLQTKINLAYLQEDKTLVSIKEITSNFSPLVGITYRWRHSETGKIRAEVRNDLSSSFYQHSSSNLNTAVNSYTNTLALDIYPTSIFILRFRLSTIFRDKLDSVKDNLSNSLELRLTAQF